MPLDSPDPRSAYVHSYGRILALLACANVCNPPGINACLSRPAANFHKLPSVLCILAAKSALAAYFSNFTVCQRNQPGPKSGYTYCSGSDSSYKTGNQPSSPKRHSPSLVPHRPRTDPTARRQLRATPYFHRLSHLTAPLAHLVGATAYRDVNWGICCARRRVDRSEPT